MIKVSDITLATLLLFFFTTPIGGFIEDLDSFPVSPATLILPVSIFFSMILFSLSRQIFFATDAYPLLIFFVLTLYLLGISVFLGFSISTWFLKIYQKMAALVTVIIASKAFHTQLKPHEYKRINTSFIIGCALCVIVALYQILSGNIFFTGRLTLGENYSPATFGAYCASAILFLSVFNYEKKIKYPLLLILWCGLLFSQARTALLALILSAIIIGVKNILMRKKQFKISKGMVLKIFIISISIILFLTSLPALGSKLYETGLSLHRILYIFDSNLSLERITAGRTTIWNEILTNHITLMGNGLGENGVLISVDYGNKDFNPHNSYLSTIYAGGVIGLIIYITFFISLIYLTFHNVTNRNQQDKWLRIVIFWIILAFGNDVFLYAYFWVPLSLFVLLIKVNRTHDEFSDCSIKNSG